ncbi:hypothetical protein EWM64_g3117 [Hericium alpestre]|uniref:Uncharacterized protein n=1 Tax=Hericium alpestre TaxID=135208 RepID=A0A4Z0A4R9_9AGAM|nr:hypothetical protein EWM64_g3117 [Hericium alpestre]
MVGRTTLVACTRRRVQAAVDAYLRACCTRRGTHTAASSENHSGLPQPTDLLEQYRGLVALGKLQYDEDQIRVIMQLRRLRKDLADYAPPALPSHYHKALPSEKTNESSEETWWQHSEREMDIDPEMQTTALTRVRSHAEELAELNTPKVIYQSNFQPHHTSDSPAEVRACL